MSCREFTEWQLFYNLTPFGEYAHDVRAGIVASTIANFSGKELKEGKSTVPADFMPFLEKPPQQTAEQVMIAALIEEARK